MSPVCIKVVDFNFTGDYNENTVTTVLTTADCRDIRVQVLKWVMLYV